ncbi:hypothetical protein CCR75_009158 [Bremia lactucae]|uniref:Carboxypeptidase D n=1 Tax=Bremia lactucae TaxID=4779 RepID=A0A976FKW2_BRELC|nr:hypothetical protein CCR75_009158 [Bremia lactucae]
MPAAHMLLAVVARGLASAQRLSPTSHHVPNSAAHEVEKLERYLVASNIKKPKQKTIDDLIGNLPGLDPVLEVAQHAGRIALHDRDANQIFYWHFQAAQNADTAPLVIWLNGGPGCSSMQGLFLGISPLRLEKNLSIGMNVHNQPVGTGMSYTQGNDYRSNEEAIAKDFYEFLTKFLQRHAVYLSDGTGSGKLSREIYIFGESHAGRWIPVFSEYILNRNGELDNQIDVKLEGIGIGNGWVHPPIQYEYSDFAHGLGLLTFGQVKSLKKSYKECMSALQAKTYYAKSCFNNLDAITGSVMPGKGGYTLNYYDVRHYVQNVSAYPFEQSTIVQYMNLIDVLKAVHGNEDRSFRFNICSNKVYGALKKFDGVSTLDKVASLLQKGLQVLFYNGQWDMMCNHYGTEKLLLNIDWNGSEAYQQSSKYTWRVKGRKEPAGFAQQGGNLTYLVVAGAGHVVPLDVPDVAADMIYRFIHRIKFKDKEQTVTNARLNATDLSFPYCYSSSKSIAANASVNQAVKISAEADTNNTWLWMMLLTAVFSSVVIIFATIGCLRRRRQWSHELVSQISDDKRVEQPGNDVLKESLDDSRNTIEHKASNSESERACSPRMEVTDA